MLTRELAGQLSLPHLGIIKTKKIKIKHKTDEQISPMIGLDFRAMRSVSQTGTD